MMRWLTGVCLGGLLVHLGAATLEVYQDGAVYRFEPKESFVGFVGKGAVAVCGSREGALVQTTDCPRAFRLCKEKERIEGMEEQADEAGASEEVLRQLLSQIQPAEIDAKRFIRESEAVGKRLAELSKRKKDLMKRIRSAKERFSKETTSWDPFGLPPGCGGEVGLKLPAGWLTFGVFYEADVTERDKVAIAQKMEVTNRSGLDIKARKASFHYAPMRRDLRPVRFSPWLVRDNIVPVSRKVRSETRVLMMESAPAPALSNVDVKSARHYTVSDLVLPSDGRKTTVTLREWDQEADYEERAYPYFDTRAYKTVRFKPSFPIDSDRWLIHEGGRLLTSRSRGAFIDGWYTLFFDVDEEMKIDRRRLYLKAKESFFGGTVKKRDGYRIDLFNDSGNTKKITLVDRIPVARRSDVEVELLEVASKLPMRYELKSQGRLEIYVTVPAHTGGSVEVLFEVSHDKKKPVSY
jgi:hypothetical protein